LTNPNRKDRHVPKKPPPLQTLDHIGIDLMKVLLQLDADDSHSPALPCVRAAIYQPTLARLYITCPDQMKDSLVLGTPRKPREDRLPTAAETNSDHTPKFHRP